MTFHIVSHLDSGQISSVLEVCAIALGLFIASNLQSTVSLSARRRLYSRGTARLRDSTWNIGVIEGITNPRCLLRDFRALVAFTIVSLVISLEVLVVSQTTSSDKCAFASPSTWTISKSAQQCYKPTPEVEGTETSSFSNSKYVSSAMKKMAQADLSVGIPTHTNVFEDTIVSGQAVRQLVAEKKEAVFSAPVVSVKTVVADSFTLKGIPFTAIEDPNVGFVPTNSTCVDPDGLQEAEIWIPRMPEYSGFQQNGSLSMTSSAGFVGFEPCLNKLVVRVCSFVGGRQNFQSENPETGSEFPVECKVHEISREGRRTDALSVSLALYGSDPIDTLSIRHALLTSVIAQNSASTTACSRNVAVPKNCTQIGWISIAAIVMLAILVLLTSGFRVCLTLLSHGNADYNSSTQQIVETLFKQFAASDSNASAPRRTKKRVLFGEPSESEEICMSIVKVANDASDQDLHRIAWTRGPNTDAEPATFISSQSIFPHTNTDKSDRDVLPT